MIYLIRKRENKEHQMKMSMFCCVIELNNITLEQLYHELSSVIAFKFFPSSSWSRRWWRKIILYFRHSFFKL